MEDNVKGGAEHALLVLVMPDFADPVGQLPLVSSLAVRHLDVLLLGLIDIVMGADVDEGLLVEVLLGRLVNQLLGAGLYAEEGVGLDQLGAYGQVALFLQLSEVGL